MRHTTALPLRYPKSKFAMRTVYSFTAASVLTSIFFSLLLFLSIDDDLLMKVMFGSLAIIFELGKFFAWYEVGERLSRRNYIATFSALVFYGILAAISIAGSVGGINSATNKAQNHVNVQQSQVNAFNHQIAALDQQIALNNEAAKKYIEMDRIAIGLARIQKENAKLREQQQALAMQRDSLPVVSQGSVLGLIDGLAKTLQIETQTAQLGLVIFLSILLDFFAAFFISLIGEELRFRQRFYDRRPLTIEPDDSSVPIQLLTHQNDVSDEVAEAPQSSEPEAEKTLYQKVVEALESKQVSCSKKAIISLFKIDPEEAEALFKQLLAEGLVVQKANNHYRWKD
ncbi:hypothetical protein SAMN02745127_02907 [Oceanospirillum multiglobuliferum]|uniref:Preprotein translocase subunit SecY n=1 Tax=Oceanospirillum multiglobuliferum TaxID=64969 RepID=A0A1T4SC21_9GAMM|nr:Preprotein translocase subunit SecY [Oceanospirillum multiglobuliferum]OPX55022.1 Preprotein translocase subunit SecY [Oceanospirillum multiglobuliferum]SKA25458.1 hypothetical protein SAMN02745127_02907 [Oceanospirillum multiglobuliferum]